MCGIKVLKITLIQCYTSQTWIKYMKKGKRVKMDTTLIAI